MPYSQNLTEKRQIKLEDKRIDYQKLIASLIRREEGKDPGEIISRTTYTRPL